MDTPRTVVLCGSSLFLAGVEASLAGRPEICVVSIHGERAAEWPGLEALRPAAVIVDAGEPSLLRSSALDQLVSQLPGVLIISLNLGSSEATLLTAHRYPVATADEVAALITAKPHARAPEGAASYEAYANT
jgi:DNA-binding NarL/FixJ family response regulator